MTGPSRFVPWVGMPVRVVSLGEEREARVERIEDDGRRLMVDGEAFTLRLSNACFVRDGEPSYGTRLALGGEGRGEREPFA